MTEMTVKTEGPPEVTAEGAEIFGYHLNRFVGDWVEMSPVERVWVTVGFEGSEAGSQTYVVTGERGERAAVEWTFEDLLYACRDSDGRIRVESGGDHSESTTLEVYPLMDRPVTGGAEGVVFGFVVLRAEEVSSTGLESVSDRAANALRAARRNAVRMFFEEKEARPVKPFLYELLQRLPEWTGCDHSASMIMTSTVETMALQASGHGRLDVLAERLFWEGTGEEGERLVGMSLLLEDEASNLLREAVRRQIADPALPYQVFSKQNGDWHQEQGGGETYQNFHGMRQRPDESKYVLVPLMGHPESQTELMGFLCLAYRRDAVIPSSVGELLATLGRRLAERLRYSPLYTLNASKLWVLRRMRERAAEVVQKERGGGDHRERLDGFIEDLSAMLPHHVGVPSVAIGVLEADEEGRRVLQYRHPHGWTRFEDLRLPVDPGSEERTDSGVSALAVRLNRPLILAGGRGTGGDQYFKNYVYVNEQRGELLDARAPGAEERIQEEGSQWRALSDYYKPARQSAYATLAYPISLGEEVFGVLTVEVDEQTSWTWWTGFGGQVFWEMVADELGWVMD